MHTHSAFAWQNVQVATTINTVLDMCDLDESLGDMPIGAFCEHAALQQLDQNLCSRCGWLDAIPFTSNADDFVCMCMKYEPMLYADAADRAKRELELSAINSDIGYAGVYRMPRKPNDIAERYFARLPAPYFRTVASCITCPTVAARMRADYIQQHHAIGQDFTEADFAEWHAPSNFFPRLLAANTNYGQADLRPTQELRQVVITVEG